MKREKTNISSSLRYGTAYQKTKKNRLVTAGTNLLQEKERKQERGKKERKINLYLDFNYIKKRDVAFRA